MCNNKHGLTRIRYFAIVLDRIVVVERRIVCIVRREFGHGRLLVVNKLNAVELWLQVIRAIVWRDDGIFEKVFVKMENLCSKQEKKK